ncbi:phytoene desaturase family protein [Mucilaginibacter myungsuensis]|uniref:Phytoene desaturase n=1 Tax=Mucilaginibacter myungsuensis TaxID=649104 RepID=A0A929KYE5_9SPHI|nr:phytoene desaturase family protein [Mucilaginibacter myungsuensis]MBE9662942.1 phytoene desaturase [Mucilaginibacter myungsuensis]MDN3598563.1 phytoene desaturase family protein [Mucilaginibacter myungsuensis]
MLHQQKRIAVIGSGFAGLSAAAYLAQQGHQVDVFEKNGEPGGRARQKVTANGYTFDMGPSWYWMPEVFEKFFKDHGSSVTEHYELELLDPGFSVVYPDGQLDIPAKLADLKALFESVEAGSGPKLDTFFAEAEFKYRVGMERLVYKPGLSLWELFDLELLRGLFKLQVFTPFSDHVAKYFRDPKLIALMEFPVLFLGAMPEETPALYSLMNYAGLKLGTWYPKGGFGSVVKGMQAVAEKAGAKFYFNEPVTAVRTQNSKVTELVTSRREAHYDAVVGAADYHYIESALLSEKDRNYSEKYWDKRVMAPSSLIFYIGVTKKLDKLQHHTLFFDEDLKAHAVSIYKTPDWPEKPLFYVCCPSRTDDSVAPAGHENLFLLMPLATGIRDDEATRQRYFDLMMDRLEKYAGSAIRDSIDYQSSYCVSDFVHDYNSYKGNAYGLANTLMQTAHLKPSMRNKHLKNLFYAGQLTVPGPGVPPAIISGQVAAEQVSNYLEHSR